jgi:hypothetical protein
MQGASDRQSMHRSNRGRHGAINTLSFVELNYFVLLVQFPRVIGQGCKQLSNTRFEQCFSNQAFQNCVATAASWSG